MDPVLQRHCAIADPLQWRRACGADRPLRDSIHPTLLEGVALPLLARLQHRVGAGGRPALAINGPVGAGKSSLARVLVELASRIGLSLAVASIDDFYRPWQERQRALAGNPFRVNRVPPGSHDTRLLELNLRRWQAGGLWHQPRFDKRLRGGEGDRAGLEQVACQALVVEGWLMGCRPLGNHSLGVALADQAVLADLSPAEAEWLPHWDRELEGYQACWSCFEELWLLRPVRWSLPRRWRFQAEARQRRSLGARSRAQGQGLDAEALARLVRSSLASLPPPLYQDPLLQPGGPLPSRAVATLDGRRRCLQSLGLPQPVA